MRALLLLMPALVVAREPAIPAPVWLAPVAAADAPGADLIARRFEDAARAELRKLGGARLVGPKERVARVAAGSPDPRVARAENLRTSGQARFERGELAEARLDLEDARALYVDGLASVKGIGVLGRTAAYLAAIALQERRKNDAKPLLWEAALLATEDELAAMPEAVVPAVRRLRKQAARRSRGSLTVKTDPPGATVIVDGDERGRSPLTVKRLAAGPHYVQVRHQSAGWAGARVQLRRRATVRLTPEATLGPPMSEPVDAGTADALLAGFEERAPETHSRRARRRAAAARKKALAAALKVTRAKTHADYLVVAKVEADGDGFRLRAWAHAVVGGQRVALEPVNLGANATNLFVPAVAFREAVTTALETLRDTPKKRKKRRRRRR